MTRLDASPRISADPNAVAYLIKNIVFNGDISVPVLTMQHHRGRAGRAGELAPPAFVSFRPAPYLRPFDLLPRFFP